jgi:integrase
LAFVEFRGRRYYLGPFGSPEAERKYGLFRAAFAENPSTAPIAIGAEAPDDLSVNELIRSFWEHAERHYRKDGRPTSELANLKPSIAALKDLFGDLPARDFGPRRFKALRQSMIDYRDPETGRDWSRNTINQRCGHVRRIFHWGVENELVPASVLEGLRAVQGLQRNRTEARETKPVRAIDGATVEATIPYLPPVVADMVRFQLLTGCRPTEVCILRPGDVDRGGDVWAYRPSSHKTEHHERERVIFVGPRAQEILQPYLERPSVTFCFSPIESEEKRLSILHSKRKTPLNQGNRPGHAGRQSAARRGALGIFGERYTKDSYNRAIRRAVDHANAARKRDSRQLGFLEVDMQLLSRWTPNQLRHTRATELQARFGVEAARVVLGHSDVATTQIYAERDLAAAAAVMKEVG